MNLVIPSTFKAIDRMTAPIKRMQGAVGNLGNRMETFNARQERVFRRLTPVLSETTRQFTQMAGAAAVASGAIALGGFTIRSVKEYETALASFRTIVSELTDTQFKDYQNEIMNVAKATSRSSIEVVQSFEKIAGLNADFAKTAGGLGLVSKAAIVLARASGDELGASAESLVGIMNQFKLAASEADRAINVLAAGQAVGAANIKQTAEAFVNFGSVASGANITLEQSVGLIQTLGKFSLFGAEAGTKLRGAVIKLQQAGVGYKSGQFQVNDALAEAKKKVDSLRGAKAKDAAITKMFGLENVTAGRILLNNIEVYKQYTAGVTGTSEAQNAAAINSKTLAVAIEELKAKFINLITGSSESNNALNKVKDTLRFVTNNLSEIISVTVTLVKWLLIWKASMLLIRGAIIAYNVALGISIALQNKSAFYVMGNTVAYGAFRAATVAATAAQWLFNTALAGTPIGWIILAIAGLILLIKSVVKNWELVVRAFKADGILGAIKAIGKVLLDVILSPLQTILEIASNLPGKMGDWAQQGANNIAMFRESLGIEAMPMSALSNEQRANRFNNNDTEYPSRVFTGVNPKSAMNDAIAAKFNVAPQEVVVKVQADQGTSAEITKKTDGVKVPKVTSTTGAFVNGR